MIFYTTASLCTVSVAPLSLVEGLSCLRDSQEAPVCQWESSPHSIRQTKKTTTAVTFVPFFHGRWTKTKKFPCVQEASGQARLNPLLVIHPSTVTLLLWEDFSAVPFEMPCTCLRKT
ncbi:hypothetical protein AAFF_G00064390 [Aldrovandia affinis]|uniref:Secreted protein n=1 Tax=Aldrovandia affinis TaxID=143900 RepID=A0AAD7T5E3_9TELE|nr:hypothetical protein AAFF_G00064390 [Aldrovandia affinis]